MSAVVASILGACKRAATASYVSKASISTMSHLCSKMGSIDNDSDVNKSTRRDRYIVGLRELKAPRIYKHNPEPTRYGYEQKHFDGGEHLFIEILSDILTLQIGKPSSLASWLIVSWPDGCVHQQATLFSLFL